MRTRGPVACSVLLLTACAAAAPRSPTSIEGHVARPADGVTIAVEGSAPPAAALHLHCAATHEGCAASVGLYVRPHGDALERCTAALIGPDRVLTASHCLESAGRHAGASCRGAWVAFPANGRRGMEWAPCEAVLAADPVEDESVMRRDVAVLRLARPITRPIVPVDPRPPEEGSIVTVVAVRPHPLYPTQHEVSSRLCRVATRQSAVDTFGAEAERVGWLTDCPSHPGNSGSPILDARGHLRALMHAGSAPVHGVGVSSPL